MVSSGSCPGDRGVMPARGAASSVGGMSASRVPLPGPIPPAFGPGYLWKSGPCASPPASPSFSFTDSSGRVSVVAHVALCFRGVEVEVVGVARDAFWWEGG